MNRIYPMLLTPRLVEAIWGGDALVTRYGKQGDASAKIGESWECWNENRVANGVSTGASVSELTYVMGPALTGSVPLADRSSFPVLTKIIDAHESLSVQVHPGDAYARRVEKEPNGKTECWVILEAKPDAELILGFAQDTDATEYRRRVKDGTLGDILRRVPVEAGDVFYIPAGTLHAIGAGIVLFETQQTSATTYRIFDWNRVDAQGKGRELHVDKAADVLDFAKSERGPVKPLAYSLLHVSRTVLVAGAHFGIEMIQVQGHAKILTEATATIFSAHDKPFTLRAVQHEIAVAPWQSVLVPAGVDRVELIADVPTSVFAVTTPGADQRVRRRLSLLNADDAVVEAFLSQF